MDRDGIEAGAQHLQQPGARRSVEQIKDYVSYLTGFMERLIEATVPIAKGLSEQSCPWWTSEVREAVHAARAARRQGAPAEALQTAIRHKKRVIQRVKIA